MSKFITSKFTIGAGLALFAMGALGAPVVMPLIALAGVTTAARNMAATQPLTFQSSSLQLHMPPRQQESYEDSEADGSQEHHNLLQSVSNNSSEPLQEIPRNWITNNSSNERVINSFGNAFYNADSGGPAIVSERVNGMTVTLDNTLFCWGG